MSELQVLHTQEVLGKEFNVYGTYENPLNDLKTYLGTDPSTEKTITWSDTLPEYDENKSIWMISAFFSEDKLRYFLLVWGSFPCAF